MIEPGADIVIRAGWKEHTLGSMLKATPLDLIALLRPAKARGHDLIDRFGSNVKAGAPMALRLVAIKKPAQAADAARRKARQDAQARKPGIYIPQNCWTPPNGSCWSRRSHRTSFSTEDLLVLYRLRWQIELGFKQLGENSDRSQKTAWDRCTLRQTLCVGSSVDYLVARTSPFTSSRTLPTGLDAA